MAMLHVDCRVQSVQTMQVDCDHGLHWSIQNLHILAEICSLDILFLEGKSPLLMRNTQVDFEDILPETILAETTRYCRLVTLTDYVLAQRVPMQRMTRN